MSGALLRKQPFALCRDPSRPWCSINSPAPHSLPGDSLASPDAPLASTFGFCIGSFCCVNEPACSGDRFSGPSPGGPAFGTVAITGPDAGDACTVGVALRFALTTTGEKVTGD